MDASKTQDTKTKLLIKQQQVIDKFIMKYEKIMDIKRMKYQRIINLLDNASNQPCNFRTKNWIQV